MTWSEFWTVLLIFGPAIIWGISFVYYKGWKHGREEQRTPMGDEQKQEPPVSKKYETDMSDFKGYHWEWSVKSRNAKGLPIPHGEKMDSILLQEIRDNQKEMISNLIEAVDNNTDVLKKMLAFQKKLYGDPK